MSDLRLRTPSESVGWFNSEWPLPVSPEFTRRHYEILDEAAQRIKARRTDEPPATDAQMPLPLLAALVLLVALLVFVAGLSIGWVAHGDAQRVTVPNKPVPVPATWRSA